VFPDDDLFQRVPFIVRIDRYFSHRLPQFPIPSTQYLIPSIQFPLTPQSVNILRALDPKLYFFYSSAVNQGYFVGDIANYISYCVTFTSDKGFGFRPEIETGRRVRKVFLIKILTN
jgi:hypothetical protein